MTEDTQNVMQAYLEAEHGGPVDEYFEPTIGEFHASTTGSCVRRLYFDFMDPEQARSGAWKHFELGNRMENVFEDALVERYGRKYIVNVVPIEIEIDDFKIVGETDPVVITDDLKPDVLWEVKSTTNLSYVRDKPKWTHVCQLHCYAYGLDLLNPSDNRRIVYIDKGSLETVVHDVSFEQGIWEHIVGKLRTVYTALMNEEPPEPAEEKHQDHFCPHKDKAICCKNIDLDGEQETVDGDNDSSGGWGL
jgi:hypothetical protein